MRAGQPAQMLSRLILIWAGLAIGVAFVATPAKFLAPSLSLPVALDVGRHTFALYNQMELLLLAGLVVLALFARSRTVWLAAVALPGAIVLAETLWLIPTLDARVGAIMAGRVPPPSNLHVVYIVADAVKIVLLLLAGWLAPRLAEGGPSRPSRAYSAGEAAGVPATRGEGRQSLTRKSQPISSAPAENTTSPGSRIHCQNRVES
jgi:hypothetical protein